LREISAVATTKVEECIQFITFHLKTKVGNYNFMLSINFFLVIFLQALEFVMEKQDDHQEAAIGLVAEIFKFKTKSNFIFDLEKPRGVKTLSLISKILKVPLGGFIIDLPITFINTSTVANSRLRTSKGSG
jgi:hypothetical protein